jgi:hypothetical protein
LCLVSLLSKRLQDLSCLVLVHANSIDGAVYS